jgi:hypothetical protein
MDPQLQLQTSQDCYYGFCVRWTIVYMKLTLSMLYVVQDSSFSVLSVSAKRFGSDLHGEHDAFISFTKTVRNVTSRI